MKMSAIQSLLTIAIPKKLPVLITGAPGVGKTDGIVQACEAAKAGPAHSSRRVGGSPCISQSVLLLAWVSSLDLGRARLGSLFYR